ncbi:hypothetical protein DOY81_008484 [Sarcophaga bullata]|nr:hypothetical protein DOY81_008484 [Sarcophaga bullata]
MLMSDMLKIKINLEENLKSSMFEYIINTTNKKAESETKQLLLKYL